jgi:hypothetical protein
MTKKLPLSDFRAVRHRLKPDDFALSDEPDIEPTDLIDEETWAGITHQVRPIHSAVLPFVLIRYP